MHRAVSPSFSLQAPHAGVSTVRVAMSPSICQTSRPEQRGARLDAVAPVAQRDEQLELESRQVEGLLVNPSAVCVAIDLEAAEAEEGRCRGGRRAAADDRLHSQQELADAERLDDVVVGTELEADHPIDLFPLRRHHDDRDVLRGKVALQRFADLEARQIGEHEVEEEHVREVGPRALEPLRFRLPATLTSCPAWARL